MRKIFYCLIFISLLFTSCFKTDEKITDYLKKNNPYWIEHYSIKEINSFVDYYNSFETKFDKNESVIDMIRHKNHGTYMSCYRFTSLYFNTINNINSKSFYYTNYLNISNFDKHNKYNYYDNTFFINSLLGNLHIIVASVDFKSIEGLMATDTNKIITLNGTCSVGNINNYVDNLYSVEDLHDWKEIQPSETHGPGIHEPEDKKGVIGLGLRIKNYDIDYPVIFNGNTSKISIFYPMRNKGGFTIEKDNIKINSLKLILLSEKALLNIGKISTGINEIYDKESHKITMTFVYILILIVVLGSIIWGIKWWFYS